MKRRGIRERSRRIFIIYTQRNVEHIKINLGLLKNEIINEGEEYRIEFNI